MDTIKFLAERKLANTTIADPTILPADTLLNNRSIWDIRTHQDEVKEEDVVNQIEKYAKNHTVLADRTLDFELFSEEAKNQVINDVYSYTRERKETLSGKALKKRRKALADKTNVSKKLERTIAAYKLRDEMANLEEGLSSGDVKVKVDENTHAISYQKDDGSAVTDAEKNNIKDSIMRDIESIQIDVEDYSNDMNFVSKYNVRHGAILKFRVYDTFLDNPENEEAIQRAATRNRLTKEKYREALNKKFESLRAEADYFDAKIKIIRSPYYSLLGHDDLGQLTEKEIDKKVAFLRGKSRKQDKLIEYLLAVKELKHTQIEREKGTTKSKKGSTTILGKKMSFSDVTTERVHNGSFDISGSTSYTNLEGDKSVKIVDEEEEALEPAGFKTQVLDGIEVGLGGSYSYHRKKRAIKANSDHLSLGADYTQHGVCVSGSVGASLFQDGDFSPQCHISTSAEYTRLGANAEAGLATKTKLFGLNLAEIKAKAKADLGQLIGSAKFSLGKYKDENDKEYKGIKIGLNAGAYLAKGNVSGSLTLLGIEAKAKAEASVGFGAKFKYTHTAGQIKGTFGLTFGIGGSISFSINYDKLAQKIKNKIKEKIKLNWFHRGKHKE